jgi:hypothetical protein
MYCPLYTDQLPRTEASLCHWRANSPNEDCTVFGLQEDTSIPPVQQGGPRNWRIPQLKSAAASRLGKLSDKARNPLLQEDISVVVIPDMCLLSSRLIGTTEYRYA